MTITVAMALSGLEPEQWNDGLKEIYMQGAILFPKSPSSLSLASSGASSYYSLESGISSMSPDSASYNPFLINDLDSLGLDGVIKIQEPANTLTDDEGKLDAVLSPRKTNEAPSAVEAACEEAAHVKPNRVYSQVMYGKRNVLNLFGNIAGGGGWRCCRPTVLPDAISSSYFENRSQYSRLQDAYPPKHTTAVCRDKDCGFVEEHYF